MTETKTCVECDAVVSQWWEEDGDSYCNCCWSAMGRSCDGCWDDECELCNGDDTEEEDEEEVCECGAVATEKVFVGGFTDPSGVDHSAYESWCAECCKETE